MPTFDHTRLVMDTFANQASEAATPPAVLDLSKINEIDLLGVQFLISFIRTHGEDSVTGTLNVDGIDEMLERGGFRVEGHTDESNANFWEKLL